MSEVTGSHDNCISCEQMDHWIELFIVDEHNHTFVETHGVLTDASGAKHQIVVGKRPILLKQIAAGPVIIELEQQAWLEAAQSRQAFDCPDEPDPVCDNLNSLGYQACEKQLLTIATGDLLAKGQDTELPIRHQAGQADKLKLCSDQSYVLKVRGFKLLTLRFGVFFDGTGNNSFSAQWGKQELEKYYPKWRAYYDVAHRSQKSELKPSQLPENCFAWPDKKGFEQVSTQNEFTNIQKLFDSYSLPAFKDNVYYLKQYITGIGTDNEQSIAPAEESLIGNGAGIGDFGVIAKTQVAITEIIEQIKLNLNEISEPYDFIYKLEFDVFGFSRGAAAARHFINLVLDGNQGQFALAINEFFKPQRIGLCSSFDWQINQHCEITFAGLFDTVAAIVDILGGDFSPHNTDNGDVKLWLDPQRVTRAVHLTADPATEYRSNFCLNQLNPASHFHELSLPGAHSDLGGGYFAEQGFRQQNYYLPLYEKKLVRSFRRRLDYFTEASAKRTIEKKLASHIQRERQMGWGDNFHIAWRKQNRGKNQVLQGQLYYMHKAKGDLSRLYLRIMVGLAEYYGVPVTCDYWDDIEEDEDLYNINSEDPVMVQLADNILASAKQGKLDQLAQLNQPDFVNYLYQHDYIHHSSNIGIANKPHWDKQRKRYYRKVFSCEKGS